MECLKNSPCSLMPQQKVFKGLSKSHYTILYNSVFCLSSGRTSSGTRSPSWATPVSLLPLSSSSTFSATFRPLRGRLSCSSPLDALVYHRVILIYLFLLLLLLLSLVCYIDDIVIVVISVLCCCPFSR